MLEREPWAAVDRLGAELPRRKRVSPVAEAAFGELHDVALVHERDRVAPVVQRVANRLADEALGALARHRLDADAGRLGEPDLAHAHLVLEERDQLAGVVALRFPLDPRVDVLGVLAEDHHVRLRRITKRARHSREVAHRAKADKEVELLADRHVERADSAADRCGQRALDRDRVVARRVDRLLRQPDVVPVEPRGLLSRVDLHPVDLACPAVGLVDGCVDHGLHHGSDVDADPVAFDERDDRVVRCRPAGHDLRAAGGNLDVCFSGAHSPTVCSWGKESRRDGQDRLSLRPPRSARFPPRPVPIRLERSPGC